jgi:hypothetical protein
LAQEFTVAVQCLKSYAEIPVPRPKREQYHPFFMPPLLRTIASLPKPIYFSNKSLFHAPITIRNFHSVYTRRQDASSGVLSAARSDNLTVRVMRSYQEECVQASLDQLKLGKKRQVVSLPVGKALNNLQLAIMNYIN